MRKIQKINNVISYNVSNEKLLYISGIENNLFVDGIKIDSKVDHSDYHFINEVLYKKNSKIYVGKTEIFNFPYLNKSLNKKTNSLIIKFNTEVLEGEDSSIISDFSIFDLLTRESKKIDRLKNIVYSLNYLNIIILGSFNVIYTYILPSLKKIWQYDISPLGTFLSLTNEVRPYEVKRFIGIHERQLIVQLSNATFLFLDSETGKQNKIIHLNTEYPLPSPVFYEDASTAHIIGDSLVWLSNQRLIQIDLKTYAVKIVKDYFNAPREEQFRFMSNSHHKGLLYFVADKGWQYVTPTHVGVMNPETGEVLWHEQLQDTGGLREAPQATDDKLYIRTNKGVLHIFEKSI